MATDSNADGFSVIRDERFGVYAYAAVVTR
jgi:hypothetical protein